MGGNRIQETGVRIQELKPEAWKHKIGERVKIFFQTYAFSVWYQMLKSSGVNDPLLTSIS
jgi:hypothetical protein